MAFKISPSILSADFSRLGEEVRAVVAAGADYIHVDVMDGRFVQNITIGPPVVACVRKVTDLPLDVHLMIVEPERYVGAFAEAGADIIGVHIEACPHIHGVVQEIHRLGKKASVTINPGTALELIDPILEDIDQVLVMSVNPGFGGQKFIESSLPRLTRLRETLVKRGLGHVDIEIDGGVGPKNIRRVADAGANVFVAGSAIYGTADYKKTIDSMRAALEG